jgi:hypothetical protein
VPRRAPLCPFRVVVVTTVWNGTSAPDVAVPPLAKSVNDSVVSSALGSCMRTGASFIAPPEPSTIAAADRVASGFGVLLSSSVTVTV